MATEHRLIVGATGLPAHKIPGKLCPEDLHRGADGLCLPGLGQMTSGERLRLLGFQTLNPYWDGVALIVQSERTLWVTLSAGEAIHVQASATGQLAIALGCEAAVPEGLDEAMSLAERLPFQLAEATGPGARLAALLGAEMAAAKRLWLGQQAVLIGQGPLAHAYLAALRGLYVPVTETMDAALVREGFRALARTFVASD
ncbi:2-dehydro-3-deoxygalactonokinase [Puniceibacterium sp. HSS470]|uniref:2-dehydro-3-deoxygalactonokinase n=1 Tax=Pseudooceanicola sediminis TaxID=2211117 RepID=UPI0011C3690F|nr:2-dehydro-3-deoxygalactonokinase [Pseudooceanicola sediminis]KAA2313339.1 2-dehydro-3-deoxygalactonokinase [Puniceibacterium sp. HSS470]